MNHPRLLRGLTLAAALLVTGPLAAHAGDIVHETTAFKVKAPENWGIQEFRVEKDGKHGSWQLFSPSRNRKMYIHVSKNNPRKKLRELFNTYLGTHLNKRVRHLRIQSYQEKDLGGAKIALAFVAGVTRRNTKGHVAKFGVLIARRDGGKRVIAAALGATKDGWATTALRLETLLGSLDLK